MNYHKIFEKYVIVIYDPLLMKERPDLLRELKIPSLLETELDHGGARKLHVRLVVPMLLQWHHETLKIVGKVIVHYLAVTIEANE
jgi:hypothetical protein